MENLKEKQEQQTTESKELKDRRQFLTGLGKWSKIAVGVALFGAATVGLAQAQDSPQWYNGKCRWANTVTPWSNGWSNYRCYTPWSNWNNGSADLEGGWNNWANYR